MAQYTYLIRDSKGKCIKKFRTYIEANRYWIKMIGHHADIWTIELTDISERFDEFKLYDLDNNFIKSFKSYDKAAAYRKSINHREWAIRPGNYTSVSV